MLTVALGKGDPSCGHRDAVAPADTSRRNFSETARRLQAILHVLDVLTEKKDLTEIDLIAIDVLLNTGRDYANALVLQIDKPFDVSTGEDATPYS